MEKQALAVDARLEAHRVWAEEVRYSALVTVALCVYARSAAAQQRFADDPEVLEELTEKLERERKTGIMILSTEDLDKLRADGFLRPGE